MRLTGYAGILALGATTIVLGKELPKDEVKGAELYDSGIVHDRLKAMKLAFWESEEKSGAMNSSQYPPLGYTKCVNGLAEAIPGDKKNTFKCKNTDMYSFLSHADLGGGSSGSSSWGWTDPTSGREFVAIGQVEGTAFAEITKEGQLVHLGNLPSYSGDSRWRDHRTYKDYMIIGSEAAGHGVQIFDMNKLVNIDPARPVTFDAKRDLVGHFGDLPSGSSHNVVVNEEKGYIVVVGALPRNSRCASGLIFVDMTDPSNPTSPGCSERDGYVHDAQCIVYRGPDTKYNGKEVCYGYNEDSLTIYDVTDKTNVNIISKTAYEGVEYTHQGWVLDKDYQKYLLLDDELDEQRGTGPARDGHPVTYIWDITSLEKPKQTGHFTTPNKGIDHNQYVIGDYVYQSHYSTGLRVADISSIPRDPSGRGVCEVAYFDIFPENDDQPGGGTLFFQGTWSSYAYFKSGFIFVNTIERGGFVVKITKKDRC